MSLAASGGPGGPRRRPLPAEVSGFVGRAGELARLAALLRQSRLVTVTGPGGVGKTRLALRAAAESTAGGAGGVFPGGVFLAELSEISDAGLLPAAVAGGLGPGDPDPRGGLPRLHGARRLLILDTCEHLAAACARFAARLLRDSDAVTILATSRQPLHVPGERVLRLGPLPAPPPVPPAGRAGPPPGGDAVELFAQRAAAALPGFAVTAATLPEVARLCQRLDGLPLAIELAALRVRALPLAVLAERLDSGTGTLTGARRGLVPRHQSLRAATEWSYRLCTPAERAVWQRLSALDGPFGLAAAAGAAACAEVPPERVGLALAGLADKSVVLADGRDRFRLPGAAREYGAWQLALGGGDTADSAADSAGTADSAGAGGGADCDAGGGDAAGGDGLTGRERQVALLVASGMSNREIAEHLVISRRTVDAHLSHIFGKLGLTSRVQLALWQRDRGQQARPRGAEPSPAARG